MNAVLLALPIVAPLLTAALTLLIRRIIVHRVLGLACLLLVLGDGAVLIYRTDTFGPVVSQAGGWPAPMGITLVADRLSALLLTTSAAVLSIVLVYAWGQIATERHDRDGLRPTRLAFTPIYLVLACGVSFSFLTGDLFNLFVAFEVMLIASYVLLTFGAGPQAVRSAMTYIVVSLLASSLFVAAVGLVYTATGSVNLADLNSRLTDVPDGVRVALALSLIVVFGIKAALFPLYFWLPDSYPLTPAPVTAVFAGLLTKVGVYAIIRTQTIAFPHDTNVTSPVLLTLAGATLLVGILGSIAQNEIKRMLSFTIVSHIGFMVMGLGFFTAAGLAAATFYVVHHIVTQTTLFCVEGLIERRTGSSALDEIGGLARSWPLLGWMFALPALALAGVPPLSGFIGKVGLIESGVAGAHWSIVVVAVVVSLLTVYAVARVWVKAFWGEPTAIVVDEDHEDGLEVGTVRTPRLMTGATAAAVLLGLALPVIGGPLYALCARAASDLMAPQAYLAAVLGG
ncbi:MAG: Na+/H+ antiporter subunit D [Actinomycetales bacterium]